MINELFVQTSKLVVAGGAAQFVILAAATSAEENLNLGPWVAGLRELGSFWLVAVILLGVGWFLKKYVPIILEQQEKRYTSFFTTIEALRVSNETSLNAERVLREHSMDAFREMLASHKTDLGGKLDGIKDSNKASLGEVTKQLEEGNKITENLVNELKSRPCQKC